MTEKEEHGIQPLDARMTALGFSNGDLVAASGEQLTHKAVQKGRRGRPLTMNLQMKIVRAFRKAAGAEVAHEELFNYRGRE